MTTLKFDSLYKLMHISIIELHKESMSFSAAHFTIFSATNRENLHGHNYQVNVALELVVGDNGLSFDYRDYRRKMHDLCETLHQGLLIPTLSPYLKVMERDDQIHLEYSDERMMFLKRDVILIAIRNITVEELSRWFTEQLLHDADQLAHDHIVSVTVKVFSGLGQSGSYTKALR